MLTQAIFNFFLAPLPHEHRVLLLTIVCGLLLWRLTGRLQADYKRQSQVRCPMWLLLLLLFLLLLLWVVVYTSQWFRLQGGRGVSSYDIGGSKNDWLWHERKPSRAAICKRIQFAVLPCAVFLRVAASCKREAEPTILAFSKSRSALYIVILVVCAICRQANCKTN